MKIDKKSKKIFFIESGILVLISIILIIFDLSLALGKLHGIVFSILLVYISVLIFFINLMIAVIKLVKKKEKESKRFFFTGLIVLVLGVLVSYLGGRLFGVFII